MLVLSRRTNEKLLLPDINVTVQVVAIRPGQVRLGIDAPPNVQVLRAEIAKQYARPPSSDEQRSLANQVSDANATLALLGRQLEAGLIEGAQVTLERLARDFAKLQEQLGTPPPPAPAPRAPLQPLPTSDSAIPVVKQGQLDQLARLLALADPPTAAVK
jgi:carbon storage regulator CsrA